MDKYSELDQYLKEIKLPKFYKAKQCLDPSCIPKQKIPHVMREELNRISLKEHLRHGMRIAVTAGSRGVANIDVVLREIVQYLKELQTKPFIIPAMGSHGGGTAEGQRGLSLIHIFAAGVIGGFGYLPGAIIGGLVIGIVENLASMVFPSVYKDIAAFVLLIIFLLVRPKGITGKTR